MTEEEDMNASTEESLRNQRGGLLTEDLPAGGLTHESFENPKVRPNDQLEEESDEDEDDEEEEGSEEDNES